MNEMFAVVMVHDENDDLVHTFKQTFFTSPSNGDLVLVKVDDNSTEPYRVKCLVHWIEHNRIKHMFGKDTFDSVSGYDVIVEKI